MILRRWLASVETRLHATAAEREIDDELRTHLEMAVEENLAQGMSEREAHRAARRALGISTSIKEARRQADSLYWLDTLLQDLRYGVRILRRSPRFAVAVVLILGLGVGMTTAVFAIVDSVLLNAVPFAEAQRLVELNRFGPTGGGPSQPAAMVESWRNEAGLFDGVEAYDREERVFTGGGEPETMRGARVSPGLFPLLGVAPEIGRVFAPDEVASPVAVISHATWRTRFGGVADIVGRPLRFGDGDLTIVGVMPASFRFPDAATVFWEPLDVARRAASGDPSERRVSVVARLGRDATFEQADARTAALAPQWDPEWFSTGHTTRLRSLNRLAGLGVDAQFASVQQGRGALFLLFGLGACMLLIACANAANLFLSQALSRTHEFAIRAAAGASRLRLCRQLVTESVLLSALAGLVGLAFGGWLAGAAGTAGQPVLGPGLLNPIDLDGRAATWAGVAALLAGVAATLPSALRAVGRDLTQPLRGHGSAAASGHGRLRGGLVAVQSALAVVLLIGALLMARALWSTLDIDLGWTAENTVVLEPRLSGARYEGAESRSRFLAQLADLTAGVPGVELAAPAEQIPFLTGMLSFGRLDTEGASTAQVEVTINHVANRYFPAAEIAILEGRAFNEDVTDQDTAIISRDLADRLWPSGAALGQRFRMPGLLNDGAWLTLVGVAGSVHANAFGFTPGSDQPDDPYEIYLPSTSRGGAWRPPRFVLVRTTTGADGIHLLKEQVWRLDPELPVTVHVMEDVVANALAQPRFLTTLLAAFALLALLLAGAGLYAVVAYETSARTRDIGVRMALGATRGGVTRHVLGRSLLQSAAGAALGLLGAIALTRLLAVPLFGSEPTYSATFATATAFLLLAAAGGAWLPARRAARTDPMAALRAE